MPLLYSFNASCRRQILALIQGKAFMKHDYVRTLHMAKDKLVENRRNLAAASQGGRRKHWRHAG
jgi:hypothetical protein